MHTLRRPRSGSFSLAGTACILFTFCAATAMASLAQEFNTLANFAGGNGNHPQASLIQGTDGNFYGTTYAGGVSNDCSAGCGTVFKVTPSGTLTVLRSFFLGDGTQPEAGLVQASDGNFYGTTALGGAHSDGTVFKITPSGTLTSLHNFAGGDGAVPVAGLVQARDGNFYGTASNGGANCGSVGCGTVFKITPSGTLTTLHSFAGGDGSLPAAGLVQASDGNFYGTTYYGGANNNGTVFKMTPSGTLTTLYSFDFSHGSKPTAGLIQATDGNFYGTASEGGTSNNCGSFGCGTVFKITPSGTLTTLHNFDSADGAVPAAALVQATDGNFYGTTYGGDAFGTVFEITPSGALTTLHGFCPQGPPCNDGSWPQAGLVQARDGNFYGTTYFGGANNDGIVFKLQLVYHTLTVSTIGNGTVASSDGYINCPGTCSHAYPDNAPVTLSASPRQGWSFAGWSGACTGTGSCNVTMSQDLSVAASFTQNPVTLTVSTSGDGTVTSTDGFINCPGTCSHLYDANSPVTLNASPAQTWAFSGWTGACSGVGPCNLTMTQDLFVTAVFIEPGHGFQLTAIMPCRLVDTRQTGGPIQGGTSRSFTVPQLGNCNIPATATAYSLNVTVVPHAPLSYLTIWPAGEAQPTTSLMNSPDSRIKANAAIVPAGDDGAVSVFVTNTADVILDIDGYFTTPGSGTLQFYQLTPCRIVDTRNNMHGGTLHAGVERDYTIPTNCGVPRSAQAYSFNITVIPPSGGLDYLTVWPKGETMPVVSTLNDNTGTIVANAAIVPAGPNNATAFYPHNNRTDLLIDVNGYFAPAGTGGLSLYPVAPCRVLDTRNVGGGHPFTGEWNPPNGVNVLTSPCAPPSTSKAFVFNATVVPSGQMPYLTLWPHGQDQPNVSTLNAIDGFITSNMAIVPTTNGSIDAFADGLTQLILDISGYFAP